MKKRKHPPKIGDLVHMGIQGWLPIVDFKNDQPMFKFQTKEGERIWPVGRTEDLRRALNTTGSETPHWVAKEYHIERSRK